MSFKHQVIEKRKQGLTYSQIVKDLGCSKATVAYYCIREKIPKPVTEVVTVPIDREELVRWLLQLGVRVTDIASATGVSLKEIQRYAQKNELVRKDTPEMSPYLRLHRRRMHLKILAVVFKGGACEVCGYHKCLQALDFHHPDPDVKEFTISRNTNRAWEALKSEVSKCQLLCANCHRETHASTGIVYLRIE